jgi:hypothetical protein
MLTWEAMREFRPIRAPGPIWTKGPIGSALSDGLPNVGSITAEGWTPGAMAGPGSITAVTPAIA